MFEQSQKILEDTILETRLVVTFLDCRTRVPIRSTLYVLFKGVLYYILLHSPNHAIFKDI